MAAEQIERLNSELEVIDSIFNGEGVIVRNAALLYTEDGKTTTQGSDEHSTDEEDKQHVETMCILNIMPNSGAEQVELRMQLHCRFIFDQAYPFTAPRISFQAKKGLAEQQFEHILSQIKTE